MATTGPTASRRGRIVLLSLLGVIVLAGLLGAAALLGGFSPRATTTHPPCDELPTGEQVAEALAAHPDLAGRIAAQGAAVTVDVGSPCGDARDAALIEIAYAGEEERERIEKVLNGADGFGVPVSLTEK